MQDLIDLAWHTKERQFRRRSLHRRDSSTGRCSSGAVYIDPSVKEGYDANVQTWVRASEAAKGFDRPFFEQVREWIERDWPFERVAYPGREISREEWDALPPTP